MDSPTHWRLLACAFRVLLHSQYDMERFRHLYKPDTVLDNGKCQTGEEAVDLSSNDLNVIFSQTMMSVINVKHYYSFSSLAILLIAHGFVIIPINAFSFSLSTE